MRPVTGEICAARPAAEGVELLLDEADVDQDLEQRIGGRGGGKVGPPGAELPAFVVRGQPLRSCSVSSSLEQRLDRPGVRRHAIGAQQSLPRATHSGRRRPPAGPAGLESGDQVIQSRGVEVQAA